MMRAISDAARKVKSFIKLDEPFTYVIAAVVVFLLLFGASAAFAQSMYCQPAEAMRIELNETYGETLKASGTVAIPREGVTLEMWNNAETGTWTALYVFAENGQACRVSNGAGMK